MTLTVGGSSVSFWYDGVGRRLAKATAGTTTQFVYDGSNFVQEQSGGGTPTANLLTSLSVDTTFIRADGSGMTTPLVDGLGSVLELADSTGTLQTHYALEPFGTAAISGTTSTNVAQFTSRENDGTGVYFYRARYYSPDTGRFISGLDPIPWATR